jgi:hypothetical protein
MKSHVRFSHSPSAQFGLQLKKKMIRIPFLRKLASKESSYGSRIPHRD